MREYYESQLAKLNTEMIQMGARCEDAISGAIQALLENNRALAEKVDGFELEIDQYERDIERLCMRLLLLQQPVATDLRVVSSALKMISDLERIGDQAADIADITKHVSFREYAGKVHIKEMAKAAIGMVTDSVDSYVKMDAELAKKVASDGEGSTHLITCTVTGAGSEQSAETVAKSVIGSALTKAAIFGADANWGRVLCAMGYSGEDFNPDKVDVAFQSQAGSVQVCAKGRGLDFDEDLAKRVLTEHDVTIAITMGEGDSNCTCWGCDLTYEYVKINGDYRTGEAQPAPLSPRRRTPCTT